MYRISGSKAFVEGANVHIVAHTDWEGGGGGGMPANCHRISNVHAYKLTIIIGSSNSLRSTPFWTLCEVLNVSHFSYSAHPFIFVVAL